MKKYVDDAVKFDVDKVGEYKLSAMKISKREMVVAVPEQTNIKQWEQLNKAATYGEKNNVRIEVWVVRK